MPEALTDHGRPRVAVIGVGGTIAFEGSGPLDLIDYGETGRMLAIEELLARTPALEEIAELIPHNFRTVGSNEVDPAIWLELQRAVTGALSEEPEYAGVVITHGTATIEETAYFLHLTVPSRRPVALVGAQRPASALSSDVPMNLVGGTRVAVSPAAEDIGVTVVLNGEVHCARDVTKADVHGLDAFQSRSLGPLGYVGPDGTVVMYRSSRRLHTTGSAFAKPQRLAEIETLPRVDIAYSYAGSDGSAIRAAVAAGAKGVVIASLVPGLLTPEEMDATLAARAEGIAVVLSTRSGCGRLARRVIDREMGVVTADDLNPQKARVLAMLALTETSDPESLQTFFDTY